MATFSLQCNSLSQIHSSVYFVIQHEMSELFDKEVNKYTKREKLSGFTQAPASPQKCV